MNRTTFLLILLIVISTLCQGQQYQRIPIDLVDDAQLYVNDGESRDLYYLTFTPKQKPVGAVVILPSGGESTEDLLRQIDLPQLATENNLVTIIPSINWGTDDRIQEIKVLDRIFSEVVAQYAIPKENFVLGGLSNGGMIALVYTQESVKNPGSTYLRPKGIFGLDVPLDKIHMYEYCEREIARNFSEAGMNEARWIMNRYNQLYGGSPQEYPDRYVEASIYSNGYPQGGNAQYLKEIPIRMYTDLDVEWLMNQRRRDLYDWNGTDIVAMINDLKLMGNEDANVIITMGQGVRLDGRRHPHSWSIMDNRDCIDWIIKLMSEDNKRP